MANVVLTADAAAVPDTVTVEKIGHRDASTGNDAMTTTTQTITIDGKSYVLLPREEFDRLSTLAKAAELPALPPADAQGNYPAADYARASLARKIIRDRVAAGLSQRELAKLAGISFENLCRIETGKHVPSVPTIDKIDLALKRLPKQRLGITKAKRGPGAKKRLRVAPAKKGRAQKRPPQLGSG